MMGDFYNRGSDPAETLFIGTYLALNTEGRGQFRFMHDLTATLIDQSTEPVNMEGTAEDLLPDLEMPDQESSAQEEKDYSGDVPLPLSGYIGPMFDKASWRSIGSKFSYLTIDLPDSDYTLRVLDIGAGVTIPEHSHEGDELTLVMKGSFIDEGERYRTGDVSYHEATAEAEHDHTHQPYTDEHCICLILTKGKLSYRSWTGKIASFLMR